MSKTKTPGKSATASRAIDRDARTGRFTLGRAAFGKVAEVEGIVVSRSMQGIFQRLSTLSPEKRRSVLAQKYGKK